MKVPYERIVQWAAGPLAIVAGYVSTQLVSHVGLFGALGLNANSVSRAIVATGTFAVGAGVTYAAHHKWLTNLALWWDSAQSGVPLPAVLDPGPEHPDAPVPESARKPDPPAQPTADNGLTGDFVDSQPAAPAAL